MVQLILMVGLTEQSDFAMFVFWKAKKSMVWVTLKKIGSFLGIVLNTNCRCLKSFLVHI